MEKLEKLSLLFNMGSNEVNDEGFGVLSESLLSCNKLDLLFLSF